MNIDSVSGFRCRFTYLDHIGFSFFFFITRKLKILITNDYQLSILHSSTLKTLITPLSTHDAHFQTFNHASRNLTHDAHSQLRLSLMMATLILSLTIHSSHASLLTFLSPSRSRLDDTHCSISFSDCYGCQTLWQTYRWGYKNSQFHNCFQCGLLQSS